MTRLEDLTPEELVDLELGSHGRHETGEDEATQADDDCRCSECGGIHSEFINQFGRWPKMCHADGQALEARRASNLRSWDGLR